MCIVVGDAVLASRLSKGRDFIFILVLPNVLNYSLVCSINVMFSFIQHNVLEKDLGSEYSYLRVFGVGMNFRDVSLIYCVQFYMSPS